MDFHWDPGESLARLGGGGGRKDGKGGKMGRWEGLEWKGIGGGKMGRKDGKGRDGGKLGRGKMGRWEGREGNWGGKDGKGRESGKVHEIMSKLILQIF